MELQLVLCGLEVPRLLLEQFHLLATLLFLLFLLSHLPLCLLCLLFRSSLLLLLLSAVSLFALCLCRLACLLRLLLPVADVPLRQLSRVVVYCPHEGGQLCFVLFGLFHCLVRSVVSNRLLESLQPLALVVGERLESLGELVVDVVTLALLFPLLFFGAFLLFSRLVDVSLRQDEEMARRLLCLSLYVGALCDGERGLATGHQRDIDWPLTKFVGQGGVEGAVSGRLLLGDGRRHLL